MEIQWTQWIPLTAGAIAVLGMWTSLVFKLGKV